MFDLPSPWSFLLLAHIFSGIHRQISIIETFGCPFFRLHIPTNYQFLTLIKNLGCPSIQILFPNFSRTLSIPPSSCLGFPVQNQKRYVSLCFGNIPFQFEKYYIYIYIFDKKKYYLRTHETKQNAPKKRFLNFEFWISVLQRYQSLVAFPCDGGILCMLWALPSCSYF